MTFFQDVGTLLVSVFFGLLIFFVMLRFILQTVRADFHNPLSQMIVRLTSPLLRPFRRLIPGIGGIDMASIILMIMLQFLELALLNLVKGTALAKVFLSGTAILALLILAIIQLLTLATWIYIIAIVVMIIVSWIQPGSHNPVLHLIHQITYPLLRPIQRMIPDMGGLDFSPLVAIVLLTIIQYAIKHLGAGLLRVVLTG